MHLRFSLVFTILFMKMQNVQCEHHEKRDGILGGYSDAPDQLKCKVPRSVQIFIFREGVVETNKKVFQLKANCLLYACVQDRTNLNRSIWLGRSYE